MNRIRPTDYDSLNEPLAWTDFVPRRYAKEAQQQPQAEDGGVKPVAQLPGRRAPQPLQSPAPRPEAGADPLTSIRHLSRQFRQELEAANTRAAELEELLAHETDKSQQLELTLISLQDALRKQSHASSETTMRRIREACSGLSSSLTRAHSVLGRDTATAPAFASGQIG